ncbi:winged helix-turn-helix transcriptional regulator [Chitinophaga filiformis]|nr:helix-turn-helix domain-containing protein [Chitinophaga filiformis]SDG36909.1 DNA-binding transcriptional regulator, HxlR family [Chitinophaga filiformis]
MNIQDCITPCTQKPKLVLAIRDAMEVLNGKWKILIIGTLMAGGKKRFMELLREVDGIAAKMLSKELQELEMHKLISRTVCNTKPITVEYEITEYGKKLEKILLELTNWGMEHREMILKG